MIDKELKEVSELFVTESNRYKEQSFLRAITDNYNNILKFTQNTRTDGNLVEVNPIHPTLFDLENLEETAVSLKMDSLNEDFFAAMKFFSRGGTAHEAFHILFTDFEVLKLMEREFRYKSDFKRKKMHSILNIGEDGFIELAGVNMFPGLEPYIVFSNELFFRKAPSLNEKEEGLKAGQITRLDLYFYWAMFYTIMGKLKGDVTDSIVLDKIEKTEGLFSKMRKDNNAMNRYELGKQIFTIIEDLIEDAERQRKSDFNYPKNQQISHGSGSPVEGSTEKEFKNRPKPPSGDNESSDDESDKEQTASSDSQEDETDENLKNEEKTNSNSQNKSEKQESEESEEKSKTGDAKDDSKTESDDSKNEKSKSENDSEGENNSESNGSDGNDSKNSQSKSKAAKVDKNFEDSSNDAPIYDISDLVEALKFEKNDVERSEEKRKEEEKREKQKIRRDDMELSKIKYSEINRGISVRVERVNNRYGGNEAAYNKIKGDMKPIIKSITKQIKAMIAAQSPGFEKKLTMGTKLDDKRLADPKRRNWQRKKPHKEPTDLNICVVIDGSGSMCGNSHAVMKAVIVLYEVALALNIPISIIEECAISYTPVVRHRILVDYSNWEKPNTKYNILEYMPDEGTREGVSLKWCNAYQRMQGNKDNLMIVIADGDPAHMLSGQVYHGEVAISDTHQVAKDIQKGGTNLVALALGEYCFESLNMIYKHTILCKDMEKLPRQLMAILKKNLFK